MILRGEICYPSEPLRPAALPHHPARLREAASPAPGDYKTESEGRQSCLPLSVADNEVSEDSVVETM